MPNSVRTLIGSGVAPQAAVAASGTIADSQTALGSTQAAAFPVNTDTVVFTTVAASTGATLPNASLAQPGDEVVIFNLGANSLTIVPPSGGTINALSVNTGFTVATLKTGYFIARNGGLNWCGMLGA